MKKKRDRALQLNVLLSAEERDMLERLAKADGLSMSDIVRQAIRARIRTMPAHIKDSKHGR